MPLPFHPADLALLVLHLLATTSSESHPADPPPARFRLRAPGAAGRAGDSGPGGGGGGLVIVRGWARRLRGADGRVRSVTVFWEVRRWSLCVCVRLMIEGGRELGGKDGGNLG